MRVFRVRMPRQLERALIELSDLTGLSYSDIIRQSLQYLLNRPGVMAELLSTHPRMVTEDTRTPAQQRAWQQNFSKLTDSAHVHQLLAEHHQRMRQ